MFEVGERDGWEEVVVDGGGEGGVDGFRGGGGRAVGGDEEGATTEIFIYMYCYLV